MQISKTKRADFYPLPRPTVVDWGSLEGVNSMVSTQMGLKSDFTQIIILEFPGLARPPFRSERILSTKLYNHPGFRSIDIMGLTL